MSDKKNIDNLFRENFENFEASPDPALWDKISDKLDAQEAEKKREGIIFFPWLYKGVGIAAAILLLFFLGNEFVNLDGNEIDLEKQTTSTTKKDPTIDDNNSGNASNSKLTNTNSEQNSSSNQIISDQERIVNENGVANNSIQQKKENNGNAEQGNGLQNAVAQQNGTTTNTVSQESSNNNATTNNIKNRNLITNENAVTNINSSENKNSRNTNANQQTQHNRSINGNNKVENGDYVLGTTTVTQNSNNGTKTSNNIDNRENSSVIAQNNPNNSTNTSNSSETNTTKTTETDTSITETAVAEVKTADEIKKSLLDVINDLHDLEKNTKVAEAKPKKWTISPNASPVYYNSLGNGSPIDKTFADNTKAGDVNLSYGVNVGYDVSKRLTVRSGIHKVDYSYSTQDIALVPSINGNNLTTIAFRTNGASFDIKDKQVSSTVVYSLYQLPSSESSILEKQIEGNLNQRMSYIEVPVELKYAVLDKKLGINVIGGVSTLLLTENSIILDSPELVTEIGEATNVNDVSFSTNIGIGIDYKISKQLEFNLEPMLKYQLNTFSGNTGNFKPYSVGVYTGVSFRF